LSMTCVDGNVSGCTADSGVAVHFELDNGIERHEFVNVRSNHGRGRLKRALRRRACGQESAKI
jgi:hypothetical protein